MENKIHVPNHQPDISLTTINHYEPLLTNVWMFDPSQY